MRTGTPSRAGPKALPPAPQAEVGGFRVKALEGTPGGPEIQVEVADAQGENLPEESFRLIVYRGGEVAETYDVVTAKRGREYVATAVKASKLITVEEVTRGALARPDNQRVVLTAPAPAPVEAEHLGPEDYVGDAADRTGFSGLEAVDEVTMVAVPDLMSAYQQGALDLESVKAVQLAMIAHCELMGDRVAILDPPPGLSPQQVKEWRVDKAGYDSKYAALYYPWVKVVRPGDGDEPLRPAVGAHGRHLGPHR